MATKVTTYGTFSLNPEFPVEVKPNRVVAASPSSGGSIQRRNVQQSVSVDTTQPTTRSFVLRWKTASNAEWDSLVSLWENSARGALPMVYTPPDGTEVAVRFDHPPRRRRLTATRSQFNVTLEEVTNAA